MIHFIGHDRHGRKYDSSDKAELKKFLRFMGMDDPYDQDNKLLNARVKRTYGRMDNIIINTIHHYN